MLLAPGWLERVPGNRCLRVTALARRAFSYVLGVDAMAGRYS